MYTFNDVSIALITADDPVGSPLEPLPLRPFNQNHLSLARMQMGTHLDPEISEAALDSEDSSGDEGIPDDEDESQNRARTRKRRNVHQPKRSSTLSKGAIGTRSAPCDVYRVMSIKRSVSCDEYKEKCIV